MTTDLERVRIYHDATKHHPHRYARSLGFLDWANQPNPFRRFEGAPLVELVLGPRPDEPPYDAIFHPQSVPAQPFNRRTISEFFECSLAISAWKSYRQSTWALRCNPSSGNLHPTEGYLISGPIEGIGGQPAIFHYASNDHVLELRHCFTQDLWDAITAGQDGNLFFVGLSSVFWREAWKYGERAFRYCQHDVGHALACLRFAAAMLGWRLNIVDICDDPLARLLGLHLVNRGPRMEWEHPELLALVSSSNDAAPVPAVPRPDLVERIIAGEWFGRPNRLSPEHVEWEIIDMVADDTRRSDDSTYGDRRPADRPVHTSARPGAQGADSAISAARRMDDHGVVVPTGATAREIILRRRSATGFDGRTSLTARSFYQMLCRLMPDLSGQAVPWDAIGWSPRIHLALFVHLVDGLRPGLYALARDGRLVPELRSAMKSDFAWSTPPGCPDGLPLFFLMEADCRRAAAQLSLGQDIAGDGAFSLGMFAQFDAPLREFGPWFYRRLFWEAGMVGQVLYLEAEAAAVREKRFIRATGIGAYFDNPVHDVLGLSGHAFQSLYHFAVGGAVDDPRLTTRPPYADSVTRRH